jgi:hypothetical protein
LIFFDLFYYLYDFSAAEVSKKPKVDAGLQAILSGWASLVIQT